MEKQTPMKTKRSKEKLEWFVVKSGATSMYVVCKEKDIRSDDTYQAGPFVYLDACDYRDRLQKQIIGTRDKLPVWCVGESREHDRKVIPLHELEVDGSKTLVGWQEISCVIRQATVMPTDSLVNGYSSLTKLTRTKMHKPRPTKRKWSLT